MLCLWLSLVKAFLQAVCHCSAALNSLLETELVSPIATHKGSCLCWVVSRGNWLSGVEQRISLSGVEGKSFARLRSGNDLTQMQEPAEFCLKFWGDDAIAPL